VRSASIGTTTANDKGDSGRRDYDTCDEPCGAIISRQTSCGACGQAHTRRDMRRSLRQISTCAEAQRKAMKTKRAGTLIAAISLCPHFCPHTC
jgi:hypothetical protein